MRIYTVIAVLSLASCIPFAVFTAAPPTTAPAQPGVVSDAMQENLETWWELLQSDRAGSIAEQLAKDYLTQSGDRSPSLQKLHKYFNRDTGHVLPPALLQLTHGILLNMLNPIVITPPAEFTGNFDTCMEALRDVIQRTLKEKPGSYVSLDLSRKNLGAMDPDLLARYIQEAHGFIMSMGCDLIELRLNYNELTILPGKIFHGLQDLQRLYLSGNQLTALPEEIFHGLQNLQLLNLTHNQLTTLPGGIFHGLQNLQMLTIDHNQLTALPAEIFHGLQNLFALAFSDNKLTGLPEGIFHGVQNLLHLFLDNNQLAALPVGIFDGLQNLNHVVLVNNPIADDAAAIEILQQQFPQITIKTSW